MRSISQKCACGRKGSRRRGSNNTVIFTCPTLDCLVTILLLAFIADSRHFQGQPFNNVVEYSHVTATLLCVTVRAPIGTLKAHVYEGLVVLQKRPLACVAWDPPIRFNRKKLIFKYFFRNQLPETPRLHTGTAMYQQRCSCSCVVQYESGGEIC